MTSGQLTELQAAVMDVLWRLEDATAARVQAELQRGGRPLALTTVSTLLRRLDEQGWVRHTQRGRQFLYRPAVERKEAASGALHRLLQSFFGGSVSAVAAELLETDGLSAEDLDEMRRLIDEKERT